MSYVPNNVEFRIVSSRAIAQFKTDQAFDFNELVNNPAFCFSHASREILLLNYEMWFKLVMKLERLMIRRDSTRPIGEELVKYILTMVEDTLHGITDVMDVHEATFNAAAKQIVRRTNAQFVHYINRQVASCEGHTIYVAFPTIVNSISNALHNLLFQLHEIEHLLNGGRPAFISYTSECADIYAHLGERVLHHRGAIYRELFGVTDFVIKNYSHDAVPQECIDCLRDLGVSVTLPVELDTGKFIEQSID